MVSCHSNFGSIFQYTSMNMDQKQIYSDKNHQEHRAHSTEGGNGPLMYVTGLHPNMIYKNHPEVTHPAKTVPHQCTFHSIESMGLHSYMIINEDKSMSASCDAAVSNIDTKKALKNPKNPTVINIEFK